MKITRKQLKKIIKEELCYLSEQDKEIVPVVLRKHDDIPDDIKQKIMALDLHTEPQYHQSLRNREKLEVPGSDSSPIKIDADPISGNLSVQYEKSGTTFKGDITDMYSPQQRAVMLGIEIKA